MFFKSIKEGNLDIRSLLTGGTPLAELRLGQTEFRLSAEGSDGSRLPVCRDDIWQEMLRMVLGNVPDGAEHAPPCNCILAPVFEEVNFAGLAGLPPAVRLMDGFFPVRNQSKRGACFAFALVALCEYMLGKKVELSEQSLFHFTKLVTPGKVESLTDGAFTLDAIHAIEEYGICPLSEWHYNPESWNYVEDPYNEGQGMALQRKLVSAQKYRFRHWRTLSNGSVLQFKQALSAGFPVYTGVLVTSDWDEDDVHRTGVIPVPKLLWHIKVMPPPLGLVEKVMLENGVNPESEGAKVAAMQIANNMVKETIDYVCSSVFGCDLTVRYFKEDENGVELVVRLEKFRGGHALCLAGYVDDTAYQGGGYFIARNSWSDTEWAPESPEMPGYALIPYAYITVYGREGVVMSEFPDASAATGGGVPPPIGGSIPLGVTAAGQRTAFGIAAGRPSWQGKPSQPAVSSESTLGTGSPAASVRAATPSVAAPPPADAFGAWVAEHFSVLDRPVRDMDGILLRPGTAVLVPDPAKPFEVLRDTPTNRTMFQRELAKKWEIEKTEREEREDRERKARIEPAVRETIVRYFSLDDCAVVSMSELKKSLLVRAPDLSAVVDLDCRVRAAVLALQEKEPRKFWFGHGFGGTEEIRSVGKESDRIFV